MHHSGIEQSKHKRDQFSNLIRSQQRRKIFAQRRIELSKAKRQQNEAQIAQAQMNLLQLFDNHKEDYHAVMAFADKLDQQQQLFEQYMEKLEEQSINYEMQQKRKEIQANKEYILRYFLSGQQ